MPSRVGLIIVCIAATVGSQNLSGAEQKEASYFPLAIGNWWNYAVEGNSKMAGRTIKWSVSQREIVHGAPVYHLWQTPAEGDEPLSLTEVQDGIAEAGTERFLFKNPLHTGDRWSARSLRGLTEGKVDAFEVISVGQPCSAGKHQFHDCAVIREVDEASNMASLTTYARAVGPVKYVYLKGLHSGKIDVTLTIRVWKVH